MDFFRGIAMLIIFIAHVPWNPWGNWIPARFGFSDATEMFVFCSGYAAAIAFGGTFIKSGFWYGTARIGYRIWQIYAAHIAMFFFIAALLATATAMFPGPDYVNKLNLGYFFANTRDGIIGLFTLSYVPNYFDILPMYMVALMMVPLMMALARVNPTYAIVFSIVVYTVNYAMDGGLGAHPKHAHIEWFFNPFGWQLIFFTGFALSMGWVKAPPPNRTLLIAAIIFVIAVIPVGRWQIWTRFEEIRAIKEALDPFDKKTDFGILRYIHFLALAYIAVCLLKGRESILHLPWARPIIIVGQNALPVFLLNMGLAQAVGIGMDQVQIAFGDDIRPRWDIVVIGGNLIGLSIVIGFAYLSTWIKSAPWKAAAQRRKEMEGAADRRGGGESCGGAGRSSTNGLPQPAE